MGRLTEAGRRAVFVAVAFGVARWWIARVIATVDVTHRDALRGD